MVRGDLRSTTLADHRSFVRGRTVAGDAGLLMAIVVAHALLVASHSVAIKKLLLVGDDRAHSVEALLICILPGWLHFIIDLQRRLIIVLDGAVDTVRVMLKVMVLDNGAVRP